MRRAALATLFGAALALGTPVPALADDPVPTPAPAPQPAPAPAPPAAPAGKLRLEVLGGLRARGRKYLPTGDQVTGVGNVRPYVARQTIRVRISTAHRKPTVIHTKIRKGAGEGTFKVRFKTRRPLRYTIYARHDATPQQVLFSGKGGAGALTLFSGRRSSLLKQGLRALGYPAGNGPSTT